MPTRATWLASVPKCPRDGEPLLYLGVWEAVDGVTDSNVWVCLVHGVEISGAEMVRRGLPMQIAEAA